MKECINKKFILDGKVVDCDQFHVDLINKGISIYEVIRIIKGQFLFAKDHLKRLQNSAHLANLNLWYSEDEIIRMIHLLPQLNHITEASKANFFSILDRTAFTPPITNVLPGITRKYVLGICTKQNIPVIEKAIHKGELKEFDAVFLTGTSTGALPVAQIDHLKFGVENQVLRTLIREFDKLVEKEKG